jgi:hypothetical protein
MMPGAGLVRPAHDTARKGEMLHLRCGDDIRDKLGAVLPGRFLRWADPLCQGPTPAGLDDFGFRSCRADYIAAAYGLPRAAVAADLAAQDAGLEAACAEDEIVLWFEHDLFDQAILVCLLDRLARQPPRGRLTIVSIDRFPGIARFIGLGNLGSPELAELYPQRRAVTPEALTLARWAWAALTAPDPTDLADLIAADTGALPFLAAALRRHLAELPGVGDGLAETERLSLRALAEGAVTADEVFADVQRAEAAPWLGDLMLWGILRRLSAGTAPLLRPASDGGWPPPGVSPAGLPLRLTPLGRAVLDGTADAIATHGIDRWVGGVALRPGRPIWRWDPAAGRLVPPA